MKVLSWKPHYGWMFGLASSMPDDTFYIMNKMDGANPTNDLAESNGYWRWLRCIKPKPSNVKLLGQNISEIDVDDYDVAILIPDAGHVNIWKKYLTDIPIVWKFHLGNKGTKNILDEKGTEILGNYPCIFSASSQRDFYGIDGEVAWSQNPEIYKNWTGEIKRAMWTCERIGAPNDARYMQRGGRIWDKIHPYVKSKRYGLDFRLGTPITSFEEMIVAYRLNRCYVECATNTILTDGLVEAMMSGMPPVVYAAWEMDRVIEHGVNGFKSTEPREMINYISNLLEDYDLAKKIGEKARETALELWGPKVTETVYHKAFMEAIRKHDGWGYGKHGKTPKLLRVYGIKSENTTVDDFLYETSKKKISELESDFVKEFSNVVTCSRCLRQFQIRHIKGMHYIKPLDSGEYIEVEK